MRRVYSNLVRAARLILPFVLLLDAYIILQLVLAYAREGASGLKAWILHLSAGRIATEAGGRLEVLATEEPFVMLRFVGLCLILGTLTVLGFLARRLKDTNSTGDSL